MGGGTKKNNKNLPREIVWMGGWMDVVSLVASSFDLRSPP